jgi:hypothetical protein
VPGVVLVMETELRQRMRNVREESERIHLFYLRELAVQRKLREEGGRGESEAVVSPGNRPKIPRMIVESHFIVTRTQEATRVIQLHL